MTSATSMSVSIECVNICKSWKGDVSGRLECSVLSCAWKAPRALTGLLASTAHPSQCSSTPFGRYGRRDRLRRCRCYTSDMDECYPVEILRGVPSSMLLLSASSKWRLCCSLSFYSESYVEISPESLWEDLKPTISYLSCKELELVHKALNLAFEAHDGQKRRSGESFIIHPVAVAHILGQLELDWESVAAGLLHDTVEDTDVVTFERIEKEFGATVRRIVEGETKGLSSKSAFQRHKQWLQHAKTRCAQHKIMKFLREQAALSASEITVDSVKEFAAESEGDSTVEELADCSKGTKHSWEKILKNVMDVSSARMSSEDIFQLHSGSIQIPKVNGKHNKCMQHTILKATGDTLSQGYGVGEMILANIPRYRDVLPGLDGWLASKVATWQNLEGHSVQWFCVVSIDRKGMMADITSALAAIGVIICSCAVSWNIYHIIYHLGSNS
ncbi:hypothetical protein AABB24_016643 [Solanum stoloniferum]|uniref:GTP diphosphokinase n=2 Tax=Solanum stoloniferum TaxID=62892 RepID=A0ABD2TUY1_9SOLN